MDKTVWGSLLLGVGSVKWLIRLIQGMQLRVLLYQPLYVRFSSLGLFQQMDKTTSRIWGSLLLGVGSVKWLIRLIQGMRLRVLLYQPL
jgi:hypothetical protein